MPLLSFFQGLDYRGKKVLIHRKYSPLSITTIYKYKPIKQQTASVQTKNWKFKNLISLWKTGG
jgi:hypothetical protein